MDRRPYLAIDGPLALENEILALDDDQFNNDNQHIDITITGRTAVYKRVKRTNSVRTRYLTADGRWTDDWDDTTPRQLVFIGWAS